MPAAVRRWRSWLALIAVLVVTDIAVLAISLWPVDEEVVRAGYLDPLPADVVDFLGRRRIQLSPIAPGEYRERADAVVRGELDVILEYRNGRIAIDHDPQRDSSVRAALQVSQAMHFYNVDKARQSFQRLGADQKLAEPVPADLSDIPGNIQSLHLFLGVAMPVLLVVAMALGVIVGRGGPVRRVIRGALFVLAWSTMLFVVLSGTDFNGRDGHSSRLAYLPFVPWVLPIPLLLALPFGISLAVVVHRGRRDWPAHGLIVVAAIATLLIASALFDLESGAWPLSRVPLVVSIPILAACLIASFVLAREHIQSRA